MYTASLKTLTQAKINGVIRCQVNVVVEDSYSIILMLLSVLLLACPPIVPRLLPEQLLLLVVSILSVASQSDSTITFPTR